MSTPRVLFLAAAGLALSSGYIFNARHPGSMAEPAISAVSALALLAAIGCGVAAIVVWLWRSGNAK
jgi:hypothetical protein